MIGRRRSPDTSIDDLEPGDYKRESETVLWCRLPNGELARIDDRWRLIEHDDGSITVGPLTEGGLSSIKLERPGMPAASWHGWLERGVWREG